MLRPLLSFLVSLVGMGIVSAEDLPAPLLPAEAGNQSTPDARVPSQDAPVLLPKSDFLPASAAPVAVHQRAATATSEEAPTREDRARFEQLKGEALRSGKALVLLEQSKQALSDEAKKNYLRAYFYTACGEMRRRLPRLKSLINAYEREQIKNLSEGTSLVNRSQKTRPRRIAGTAATTTR